MLNSGHPVPNCVRYGFGDEIGFVELHPDGTAEFYLGKADPLSHGIKMTAEQVGVLREVIQHLERRGFRD